MRRAESVCADGATPLPGICVWRHILAQPSKPLSFQTSQATTQITSCQGLELRPQCPLQSFRGLQSLQGLPRATLKEATLRAAIFAGWSRPPLPRNSQQPGVPGKLHCLVFKGAYWQVDCQSEEENPCVVLVPSGMGGSVGYTDRLDLSCL